MNKRGGKRSGAGRRRKADAERRVKMTVWVLPATKDKLGTDKPGHVIDVLVL